MRLDTEPVVEKKKRKGISLLPAPSVHTKSVRPRKRPAPSKHHKSNSTSPRKRPASKSSVGGAGESDNLIDLRTPIVSHLTYNPNNLDISNTVRIHGLPVATKRGDLMRFFAGLDPVQIYVLPQNNAHILEWDAEDDDSEQEAIVKRHPNCFRVFVRFASAPIASLAAQRSGEEIYMGKTTTSNNDRTSRRQGATIAVSQVPKTTAKYLSNNMVRM